MMRLRRLLAVLLSGAMPCVAAPTCAESIAALRELLADPGFPLQWRETTMDDGKPLVLSILERDGALSLSFVKAQDGLWAEGPGAICATAHALQARFAPDKLSIGPAAHWAMAHTLATGVDFSLARVSPTRLRVGTVGWSGVFAAEQPAGR